LHALDAGLTPQFQIIDSQEQLAALKRVMKALNLDEERVNPRQLQNFVNGHKEQGLRAENAVVSHSAQRPMQEAYAAYEVQCQREGTVDFAELLLRCVELWQHHPVLREHYQARFKTFLVDEFQDTNPLQYRWLRLLCGPTSTVFAVGDDDQSIYSFRGAEIENMRHFERDYGVTRVLRLEQNYRSLGTILEAANALIQNNAGRFGKTLWTEGAQGEPIRVYEGETDGDEARFIAHTVIQLREQGTRLSDMVLLYRSNAQSRALEQALFSLNLPYRVHGGLRFFERQEIRHALAYLRLAVSADDDAAFLRVINFPPRGIGARSLENLQVEAQTLRSSLFQATRASSLTGKAGQGVQRFVQGIDQLAERIHQGQDLPGVIQAVLEVSGLLAHYRQDKEGIDRVANLEELVAAAVAFTQEEGSGDVLSFLAHASLEAGEHEAAPGSEAIQMMTVHAAKGLEFEVVFVAGLEDGLFPHENALQEARGLEEERRLAYVALTRARRQLYLTHAQSRVLHGQMRYGVRSRFLEEIPESLCHILNPRTRRPELSFGSRAPSSVRSPTSSTESTRTGKFHIGQRVRHDKFGEGVVLAREGQGDEGRVQVNFRDVGTKWLALAFARLIPL
jgi:DNA helicase-2/ATP-dependent DNA helicase PcrA